ncbi:MAG: RHS repeat-associated core domain-containing protein, partial [Thermosynechococcaceae cyanobacterium]
TGEVTTYTWDYRNRLTAVVTNNNNGEVVREVEYAYDAYDRRIEKSVDLDGNGPLGAEVERFVYDGDHIALVFDGEGNQTHRYLHGDYVDQVLAEELADGSVRWALTDNQGTVRDVVDSDGNVLNHISYDSFGNVTGETNPDIDFRFGYTGREFDEETGQYYYRARYFDSGVGRFISEDPIGFDGGDANLYRYVGNGPVNATDPSGLRLFRPPVRFPTRRPIGPTVNPSGPFRSPTRRLPTQPGYPTTYPSNPDSTNPLTPWKPDPDVLKPLDPEGLLDELEDVLNKRKPNYLPDFITAKPSNTPPNSCPTDFPDDDDERAKDFAHGTSRESARNIVKNGINRNAASQNSSRGRNMPGSFHTFDVDEQPEAVQLAYEAGLRKAPDSNVVIMRVPEKTYNQLVGANLVIKQEIAESGVTETVFRPGSFEILNRTATFPHIIDPNP